MEQIPLLLADRMRPKTLDEIALPAKVIACLKGMAASGHIQHMIFAGPPGTGKTATAEILTAAIKADVSEFTGSSKLTAEDIRDHFVRTLNNEPKVILIQEAEFLNKNTQAALRGLVEKTSNWCRFIFTTNDLRRIDPALRGSRLLLIRYYLLPHERPDIINGLVSRYETTLTSLDVTFDKDRLREIITMGYPDLRGVANTIEFEMRQGQVPTTAPAEP